MVLETKKDKERRLQNGVLPNYVVLDPKSDKKLEKIRKKSPMEEKIS
jgi:hypothetical protein